MKKTVEFCGPSIREELHPAHSLLPNALLCFATNHLQTSSTAQHPQSPHIYVIVNRCLPKSCMDQAIAVVSGEPTVDLLMTRVNDPLQRQILQSIPFSMCSSELASILTSLLACSLVHPPHNKMCFHLPHQFANILPSARVKPHPSSARRSVSEMPSISQHSQKESMCAALSHQKDMRH